MEGMGKGKKTKKKYKQKKPVIPETGHNAGLPGKGPIQFLFGIRVNQKNTQLFT